MKTIKVNSKKVKTVDLVGEAVEKAMGKAKEIAAYAAENGLAEPAQFEELESLLWGIAKRGPRD